VIETIFHAIGRIDHHHLRIAALGNLRAADCLATDRDGNAAVSINELIEAVRNALDGC
jgi:hypothetical protein